MRVRWRRNGDGVDIVEHVGQDGRRLRDAEAFGSCLGLLRVAPDERTNLAARGLQRAHVRQTPEVGADDGDANGHAGRPAAFATIESIVY